MAALTAGGLAVLSLLLCVVFYNSIAANTQSLLRSYVAGFTGSSWEQAAPLLEAANAAEMRVTVIAPGGEVLYDNTAPAATLGNHAGREEVAEALLAGAGEASRFSDTLGEETWYLAERLADGNVLRVARTGASIFAVFAGALPPVAVALVVVLLGSYLAASILARRLVAPINVVNLDTDDLSSTYTPPYDELAPFARTINTQRAQIARQF
jgi:two-component system phosphate regulon sensor histidine kinase PhoR